MSESRHEALSAALGELAALLLASDSFVDLMDLTATLAVRTIPAAWSCGITVASDGHSYTIASSDATARKLDEQQYAEDEGPCLQAMHDGIAVRTDDLAEERRWGEFPARALDLGARSVYAVPLIAGTGTIGVLNLYADAPGRFDAANRRIADGLAGLVALTVTAALRNYGSVELSDNLRTALTSRAVIDQAIGIVIATRHCTPREAFSELRAQSQNRNLRIATVAADVVAAASGGRALPG